MDGTGTDILDSEGALFDDVVTMIESARVRAATVVNSELLLLYWSVGKRLDKGILGGERAVYGQAIVKRLSERLTERYGRGYSWQNLFRMIKLAQLYPDAEIFSTLSRILSWSHFVELLALETPRQDFYASFAAQERWSVRALRASIASRLYERTVAARGSTAGLELELASMRESGATVGLTFRDPYVLDFLGLPADHTESQLEQAILDDLQRFLLELGSGFAFVARQKRIIVDGEDYYLDLLFYHLQLRRYLVIELKTRKLHPADYGQLKLYSAWLDTHERGPYDEPTLGLILCAAKGEQQVQLLGMDAGEIRVAEYITEGVCEALRQRIASGNS